MSDLRNVPGIGAKKEAELIALGYPTLDVIKDADPDDLYLRASLNAGETRDKSFGDSIWRRYGRHHVASRKVPG